MIPPWLPEIASTADFWEHWFFEQESHEPYLPESLECRFDVGGPLPLLLTCDAHVNGMSLYLAEPDAVERMSIAWDDQVHWHPHLFQWSELDVICRAVAALDPDVTHPGLVLLLLHRFAPICVDDDLDRVVGLLEAAWATVPAVPERAVTRYIERLDRRRAGFVWRDGARGSTLEGRDGPTTMGLYTTRRDDNDKFPWVDFETLLSAARETASASGPASEYHGMRTIRESHALTLDVRGEPQRGQEVRALDEALRSSGIGTASHGGGSMEPVPGSDPVRYQTITYGIHIELRGDLEPGLDIIRSVIAEFGLDATLWSGFGASRETVEL